MAWWYICPLGTIGAILDGFGLRRIRMWKERAKEAEAKQWAIDNQLARRNLTLSEIIAAQESVAKDLEEEAKERHAENMRRNQKQSQSVVNLPPIEKAKVCEQMAKKVGVSEKTYRDAKR